VAVRGKVGGTKGGGRRAQGAVGNVSRGCFTVVFCVISAGGPSRGRPRGEWGNFEAGQHYARIHTLAGLSTQFEPPDHDTPTIHNEIRNCLGHGVFG